MLFNQVLQEQSNKFLLPNLPSAPLLWSLFPFVLFPSSIFAASKSMYPSKLNLWLFWAAFRFFLAESLEEEAAGDYLEAAGDSLEAAAAALAARKAVFFPLFQDFVAVRGSSATVPSWHTIVSDSVGNNPTRTWPSGIMATTIPSNLKWPFSEGIREPVDGDFGNLLSEQRDRLRDLQRRSGERLSAEHQLRSRDLDQSDSDSEERQNCEYPVKVLKVSNRKTRPSYLPCTA